MAKKKANSLELSQVQVKIDEKTGSLRITSKDPDLRGKAFNITLTSSSATTETLLELMREKGVKDAEADYYITNKLALRFLGGIEAVYDPTRPLEFVLGETFNSRKVRLNFEKEAHLLIAGLPGGGKTVAIRSLIEQATARPNIRVHLVDAYGEATAYGLRFTDTSALDADRALKLLESLATLAEDRYKLMQAQGVRTLSDEHPYELLLVDGFDQLFNSESPEPYYRNLYEQANVYLRQLITAGKEAKIQVVMTSQRPDRGLVELFKNRILFGENSQSQQWEVLGEKPQYGSIMLKWHGRGILKTDEGLTLFQSIFAPFS